VTTKKNTNTNEQEKDESKSGGVVSDLGWLVYEVMKLSPVAKIKNHHVDTVGRGVVCVCAVGLQLNCGMLFIVVKSKS
jgi:hypothetical protein